MVANAYAKFNYDRLRIIDKALGYFGKSDKNFKNNKKKRNNVCNAWGLIPCPVGLTTTTV